MRARKLDAGPDELLDPLSPHWGQVEAEAVALEGTPVSLQPSRYIRAKWSDRPTGTVRSLAVRAAHNGRQVLLHLEWRDPAANREYADRGFPDGAAVLFPLNGAAPLQTMGSPEDPVNAWHWRADTDVARNLIASGLGTIEDAGDGKLSARSSWAEGVWRVVLCRPLRAPRKTPAVRFRAGRPSRVSFAVWEGSNGERGGIKSFSPVWRELTLER